MLGSMSKKDTFALLDHFHSQGGNFIDTSNNYQNEESELWIGEWMAQRPGLRDEMVVATKYSTCFTNYQGHDDRIHSNNSGNGTKSLHVSVRNSLRKLQTDYIDILYLHWWDMATTVEEVMQALNFLVQQGKVLYLGVSDTPAWVVAKANQYARDHGLRPFVVYQGKWSAADRDFERDIIPMCVSEGMGFAPWGALGGGNFKTKAQREAVGDAGRKIWGPGEKEVKVTEVLETVAKRHKTAITSVALAYVMAKTPYVFPIVGGRTIDHLKGNIDALGLALDAKDIEEIEGAYPFDVGFPGNFLAMKPQGAKGPRDVWLKNNAGTFEYVDPPNPIQPGKKLDSKEMDMS